MCSASFNLSLKQRRSTIPVPRTGCRPTGPASWDPTRRLESATLVCLSFSEIPPEHCVANEERGPLIVRPKPAVAVSAQLGPSLAHLDLAAGGQRQTEPRILAYAVYRESAYHPDSEECTTG